MNSGMAVDKWCSSTVGAFTQFYKGTGGVAYWIAL
jgi:hypothetical protein